MDIINVLIITIDSTRRKKMLNILRREKEFRAIQIIRDFYFCLTKPPPLPLPPRDILFFKLF